MPPRPLTDDQIVPEFTPPSESKSSRTSSPDKQLVASSRPTQLSELSEFERFLMSSETDDRHNGHSESSLVPLHSGSNVSLSVGKRNGPTIRRLSEDARPLSHVEMDMHKSLLKGRLPVSSASIPTAIPVQTLKPATATADSLRNTYQQVLNQTLRRAHPYSRTANQAEISRQATSRSIPATRNLPAATAGPPPPAPSMTEGASRTLGRGAPVLRRSAMRSGLAQGVPSTPAVAPVTLSFPLPSQSAAATSHMALLTEQGRLNTNPEQMQAFLAMGSDARRLYTHTILQPARPRGGVLRASNSNPLHLTQRETLLTQLRSAQVPPPPSATHRPPTDSSNS